MYLNQIAWIAWPIWMPLVGVFWAKMWRRSGLVTTGELIELRYSGKAAAAFRGFYGVYACFGWATVFLGYGTAMLAADARAADRLVAVGGDPRLRRHCHGVHPARRTARRRLHRRARSSSSSSSRRSSSGTSACRSSAATRAMLDRAMAQRDATSGRSARLLGDEHLRRSGDARRAWC